MNEELTLQQAETLLAPYNKETLHPEPNRLDVVVTSDDLHAAVTALHDAKWGYLCAITGLDNGPEANQMEALYHFAQDSAITTLRVRAPRSAEASVPTIADIIPPAVFFERELHEMLGFDVKGLSDSSRLFLPDDFPADLYPMRTDYKQDQPVPVVEVVPDLVPDEPTKIGNRFIVPIGPQHPALKEPGHFEFTVDGEIVTGGRMRLGYAHRGIEKAAESRNWFQNLYLFERVCGICSHIHATAYCQGVEKLAHVEVPARAQAIRELVSGLERIHSHLLWLGVAAHEAGFDTLFMYSWRDRETVMNILESLTGNRVHYSANVLGGVKFDVNLEQIKTIREGLDYLEGRVNHYLQVATTDAMLLQRTRGIGTINREEAELYGLVGPTARASGVVRDIRVEAPYGAYTTFPVTAVTDTAGDLEARMVVRLKEMLVTCASLRTILDNLPAGDLTTRMPRKVPAGETISRVEAPRGELFYFIKSDGTENPARVHLRTPSICNWTSVLEKAVGAQLADIPMMIAGMDPCFSCNDRLVTVVRPNESHTWSWRELRDYGIEHYKSSMNKGK